MGQEYIRNIASLASIPSLGPVLYFNDFSKNNILITTGTGAEEMKRDTSLFLTPPAALKISTDPVTPLTNDSVNVKYYWRVVESTKLFAYIVWRFSDANETAIYNFRFFNADGTYGHNATFRYDHGNEKWLYLDSANQYQDVPGGAQKLSLDVWNQFSMGIDLNSRKFIFLKSSSLKIDLSAIDYRAPASVASLNNYGEITGKAQDDDGQVHVLLDSILISSAQL